MRREQIVRKRDFREIAAAFIGMGGFVYTFIDFPHPISRIGSVFGFIALIFIINKLRSNRKSKLFGKSAQNIEELDMSIHDQLTKQKQFMSNQMQLLNSVMYWMSIPIFLANALIIWGISNSELELSLMDQVTEKWATKLIITLVLAVMFGFVGLQNRKAARVNWKPLVKKIDVILEGLG